MNIIATAAISAGAFVLSAGLTEVTRRRALAAGRHDVPNERSSHQVPTPRGGGVGLAVAILTAAPLLLGATPLAMALALGGGITAGVGFVDDRFSLSARARLVWQAIAGGCLAAAWGVAPLALAPGLALPAVLAPLFVVLFAVWMTNLYNFMDGIDGIAGAQAVTAGATLGALAWSHEHSELATFGAVIAAAAAGFLTRNWPPARIFMGDVGSAFLGFVFAAMALVGTSTGAFGFPAVAIVMAPFVVDATYTLVRRALRRQRVWEAHRSHAYQRLARSLRAHRPVSLGFLALGAIALAPLAWLAESLGAAGALSLVAVVWSTHALAAWAVGAGLPDDTPGPLSRPQAP
jgi:Fuc2NAc and GlcNAc transferase